MPPACRATTSFARRPIQTVHPRVNPGGFSLVELLVVMAVISILASLSVSTLSGSRSGQSVRNAIIETSGYLDVARANAAATNTYVYVAIDTSKIDEVDIVTFESRTGLDALNGKGSVDLNSDPDVRILRKPVRLEGVSFRDAGDTYQPNIPDLPSNNSESVSTRSIRMNHAGKTLTFDRLITFHPSGQMLNGGAFSSSVEFGYQETKGTAELPNPVAFQISGLTGQTRIYRP